METICFTQTATCLSPLAKQIKYSSSKAGPSAALWFGYRSCRQPRCLTTNPKSEVRSPTARRVVSLGVAWKVLTALSCGTQRTENKGEVDTP